MAAEMVRLVGRVTGRRYRHRDTYGWHFWGPTHLQRESGRTGRRSRKIRLRRRWLRYLARIIRVRFQKRARPFPMRSGISVVTGINRTIKKGRGQPDRYWPNSDARQRMPMKNDPNRA